MIKFFKNFRKDEDGAVTVDWVVLTAAVVGLAIVAFGAINENAASLAGATADEIGTTVPTYSTGSGG